MVEGQGLLGGERASPAVAEKRREAWRILAKGTPFYPGHLVSILELRYLKAKSTVLGYSTELRVL